MENSDYLSDIFATLRLRSDIYFRANLAGAFAISVPADRKLIRFHYVRRGICVVRAGEDWHQLEEGDLVVLPNGVPHVLADAPADRAIPLPEIISGGALGANGVLEYGAGEGRVQLLCGYCGFDEEIVHPVVAALPDSLVLKAHDLGSEPWILAALRLLGLESENGGQGMRGILSRLLEIVLIQVLRRPELSGSGFAAAIADPKLSRSLLAMHRDLRHPWTVADLARLSGMSRATFSRYFDEVLGVPPIAYLTTWRLLKARLMLRESDLAIDEIALRCGYSSLPSFTRRYKATFGVGPGTYRRTVKERR